MTIKRRERGLGTFKVPEEKNKVGKTYRKKKVRSASLNPYYRESLTEKVTFDQRPRLGSE